MSINEVLLWCEVKDLTKPISSTCI